MKVICIDDHFNGQKLMINAGETYTASQCDTYPNNYDIDEVQYSRHGRRTSYRKNLFISLSEIDEKEFERNYNNIQLTNNYKS